MNQNYSPVALVVDDDEAVVQRLTRNFLSDTSMGVLPATNLRSAADLLETKGLRIDALVVDLNFNSMTRDQERNLADGLDFLKFAENRRPDLPSVVVSVEGDDDSRQRRAKDMGLHVHRWYQKLGPMSGALTPWATVERACLTNALRKDSDFRSRMKELKIEVRDLLDDEAIAEKVRSVVQFPRLTYLTDVGDEFEVLKPIEVLCSLAEGNRFSASAPLIGIATSSEGDSLYKSVQDLGFMLAAEAKFFQEEKSEPMGFAAMVKRNLNEFLKPIAK